MEGKEGPSLLPSPPRRKLGRAGISLSSSHPLSPSLSQRRAYRQVVMPGLKVENYMLMLCGKKKDRHDRVHAVRACHAMQHAAQAAYYTERQCHVAAEKFVRSERKCHNEAHYENAGGVGKSCLGRQVRLGSHREARTE